LFASKRCCASIWPETFLCAVVGGEYNDGVAGDSQIVELLQELSDIAVELDHSVRIKTMPGLADGGWLQMREDVHSRGVHVAEPGHLLLGLALHEVEGSANEFFVNGFHSLPRERPGVLDHLLADLSKYRVDSGVVLVARLALEDAARAELLPEVRIFRVI